MSIKKNFGYNLILTFCSYLFPLLTYPYVSRVLGVNRIGTCNFVDSIIDYFVLFSAMGVLSYGVREIAKCKDDKQRRSEVFTNLFCIHAIGTSIACIILLTCTITLDSLSSYRPFLFVGLGKLVFNLFLIEWFYQGIQMFRYITIRSVLVRLVYVIAIFIFVKDVDDAIKYYMLNVLIIVFNAVINWRHASKYRSISFKDLSLTSYLVPVFTFGYYRILTSMYTTFNTTYLGFVHNDTEVGYFTTATRLYVFIMGVFTAFTTVMVPKISELYNQNKTEEMQAIASKTFSILTILTLPTIFTCQFLAPDIIQLMAGTGYEGAITPFKIVITLLLIIGIEQIAIQQFLMASNSTNSIFTVSTIGAVTGILLNLMLTPSMGAVGSAIAWGCSELSVLCIGIYLIRRIMNIHLDISQMIKNIMLSLIYILPLWLAAEYVTNNVIRIAISVCSTLLTFVVLNFVLFKNDVLMDLLRPLLNRFGKKEV